MTCRNNSSDRLFACFADAVEVLGVIFLRLAKIWLQDEKSRDTQCVNVSHLDGQERWGGVVRDVILFVCLSECLHLSAIVLLHWNFNITQVDFTTYFCKRL